MSSVEERLNAVGKALRGTRRPFDVGSGLRRLAEDAGYLPPARTAPCQRPDRRGGRGREVPPGPKAGHQLSMVARWVLNQPQAADHVERLAEEIGANGSTDERTPLKDMDVKGALVFACMLYLAGHPESASFWWQLAGGAGDRTAAYCVHLHHLELGELREAGHWLDQLQDGGGPDDKLLKTIAHFAWYVRRDSAVTPVLGPGLTQEVERLATQENDDVPVLLERELADRLQDCANQR